MTNKNPESGAYETPAADSHINNLEWIIQKRSGSNPSNNILSRSLSAQWGLKQQTDTESNTLRAKNKLNQKQENIIFFSPWRRQRQAECVRTSNILLFKKKMTFRARGVRRRNKKKKEGAREKPTPPQLPVQQLTKGAVLAQWIHRLHCVWIWYSASER